MPQSLTNLYIHLVFSTKNREHLLSQPLRDRVHAYLATVLNNHSSPSIRVGGTSDHIHALFRMSKNLPLTSIVEELKTASSKWVKTQSSALAGFHWQSGYGGFSVGAGDVDKVADYIVQQESHHRIASFQEEFRRMLENHGIEYDERYVWD